MTAQAIRLECQLDLGIERAREIALDHHAAEPLLAPDLYGGPASLAPLHCEGLILQHPGDRHAPRGQRQRAECRGVDCQLMQREAEVLRSLRLERDRRAI